MLVATVLFLKNLRLTPLGAMVNSIVACLAAFVQWCIVALVVLVPFAVLQFNLFFPNSLLKSVDSGLDCTGLLVCIFHLSTIILKRWRMHRTNVQIARYSDQHVQNDDIQRFWRTLL